MKRHGILQKYFSSAIQTVAGFLKSSVGAGQGSSKDSSNGDAGGKKKE